METSTFDSETIRELKIFNKGLLASARLTIKEGDALVAEEMGIRVAMNMAEIERLRGAKQ
ncbi:MAG: hypothetical protein ABSH53_07535 [Holophaga sp.]|jgi:hypothetical protein